MIWWILGVGWTINFIIIAFIAFMLYFTFNGYGELEWSIVILLLMMGVFPYSFIIVGVITTIIQAINASAIRKSINEQYGNNTTKENETK